MASRAEDLFNEIENTPDKTAYVEGWLASGQQETEYLDFKHAGNEGSDGTNWSKALSSFANTEGGVIGWGITAKRGETGIDCVVGFKPIAEAEKHVQFLKNHLRDATNEPIQGVRHLIVPASANSGSYVISFIPEGQNKPYRAMRVEGRPYYQRIGDSTEIIPHGVLRTMFFPKQRPVLYLSAAIEGDDVRRSLAFTLFVMNTGRATARDLVIVTSCDRGIFSATDVSGQSFPITETISGSFAQSVTRSLHPGFVQKLIRFEVKSDRIMHAANSIITVACFMLDEEVQTFRHKFSDHEAVSVNSIEFDRIGTPVAIAFKIV